MRSHCVVTTYRLIERHLVLCEVVCYTLDKYRRQSTNNIYIYYFSWRWGGSNPSVDAWLYASILRTPQVIWVWRATVEWYIYRREPKNSEKNLSQRHFVHHKSHTDWLGSKPEPPRWVGDVRWWSFAVKIVLDLRENIYECTCYNRCHDNAVKGFRYLFSYLYAGW
jgi:hypothetical protein